MLRSGQELSPPARLADRKIFCGMRAVSISKNIPRENGMLFSRGIFLYFLLFYQKRKVNRALPMEISSPLLKRFGA